MADKAAYVRTMFTAIAGRYDLLNRLLSGLRDSRWRRFTVARAGLPPGGWALDVGTGTGELAFALASQVGQEGRVLGIDFCQAMLDKAMEKQRNGQGRGPVQFMLGQAERLPFHDGTFDCATIAFALRNVADIETVLEEMARVVKPGGRVVSLELVRPTNPLVRKLYFFYMLHIAPWIGGLVSGNRAAYKYLPDSILSFPSPETLKGMMGSAGLRQVETYPLAAGIAVIHVGVKGG